ncbi:outer membrane lipoprotein [Noviherbaspirillum aerium]|uniref:glycine zipper 2TM domain-containing protein n=1 Tax=Noviherbaspirillum aerium TaxID=2588497 RepID=UPI00124E52CD|nr:glycine zipper 2TM domain-containing protein [Noviherbaspirillum aerium]
MHFKSLTMTAILAALALAACSSTPAPPPVTSSTQGVTMVQTGQVTEVKDVTRHDGRSTGLGSFIGSILGGIAGSNIGSGTGSAVAGIGGAIAGGMAGQHAEQSNSSTNRTEVTVRFDNGEARTYAVAAEDNFRVGETVRVTSSNGVARVTR